MQLMFHPDETMSSRTSDNDLMDSNKKVEFGAWCKMSPSESKILMNIIKNHPLRFSIAASASVPWIYMAQFWHTLKEDGLKNRLNLGRRYARYSPSVHPTVIELDEDEIKALQQDDGGETVAPAVFIGGERIGGLESLVGLHLSGHLVQKLIDVGAQS
ncbi:retrovirus-related pol polyprotein from transposon TNT 1-94 [Tanacetum coccineum]